MQPHFFQLLVAEKRGRIRLYDLSTEVPIQSLDAPLPPLLSADWSPSNPLAVGGVCMGDWCIWDLSKSRYKPEREFLQYLHTCIGSAIHTVREM